MRALFFSVLLIAVIASPGWAQLPDSPTGRGGNTVIEMFKSGADSVTEEFFKETFSEEFLPESSVEQKLQWLREVVDRTGPLVLRGVRKTGPFAATIMGRSANDESIEIQYQVADTAPHQIVELVVNQKATQPRRQLTLPEMVSEARSYLEGLGEDQFSGTVLVARGDEVLLEMAKGLASRRYGVANNMDTRFNLGSINKIFTKIAIAQLASRGKLGFDDRVIDHLPDYPNRQVAETITIQQIATHTAGLGDIFTEEFARTGKERFQTAEDYFDLFAHQPLLFDPGTSQRYSNGGYMVLGAIIEAASGQTYDQYVEQNIFDPAGMTATGSFAMSDPVPNLATGYTRQVPGQGGDEDHHEHGPGLAAPWRENSFMIPFTGTPAGGGYATAGDLLKFRQALTGGELLDARYTAWVVTNSLPAEAPDSAGIALGVAGGARGVNAEVEIGGEYTIVVLANLDPPSASEVAQHLLGLLESLE